MTRPFFSNSRPSHVLTDAGPGYVKGLGSPAGDDSLASELIAAELATQMGLSVPPFAVIPDPQLDIPMLDWQLPVMGPPLFFSQEVDGTPSDGTDTFLKRMDRPQDVAKLVIFDTWVRNIDRWLSDGHGVGNRDNLLFGEATRGKFRAYPIDHASCFVEAGFDELEGPAALHDQNIYGLFPEFRPYLNPKLVANAVESMLAIPAESVREIVNSIPKQWGMTGHRRDKLFDLIVGRAERVATYAPPLLVAEPEMPFRGGGGA